MAGEQTLWSYLNGKLRHRWDAQRHEDRYDSGIPDTSYGLDGADGWIELKVGRWPARGGPLRLRHPPTLEQCLFLENRGRHGAGLCWVLLYVQGPPCYALVHWTQVRRLRDPFTREELRDELSHGFWAPRPDVRELIHLLTGGGFTNHPHL